ncbi:MAG: type II toxin-antitoxin system RelB/DinJ family antitoxin [Oscillospiraceae bacterium]|nr:type II toxin-antitoxin system RelB/DinJ family antitoxin [Oscillospiraceae bacterium]
MKQVSFRIEEDVKNNAEKALKEMGLTMSAAITIFLVKVGRERRIPFDLTANFQTESLQNDQDTSNRIGAAKGKFCVPESFAEWDEETKELFEDGGII